MKRKQILAALLLLAMLLTVMPGIGSPVLAEDKPVITEAPIPPGELTAEPVKKTDGKPVIAEEPLPPGKIIATGTTGKKIPASARMAKSAGDGYPECYHPYDNDMDTYYGYKKEGANYYSMTFSSDTEVENGYDYIYFYDSAMTQLSFTISGTTYTSFTGTQLAGRTVAISSSMFYIRIKSDVSVVKYGFRFTNITPSYPTASAATIYLIEQASYNKVHLRWNYVYDATLGYPDGYTVYRSTSSGGTYSPVQWVSTTYTTNIIPSYGTTFFYKIRPFDWSGTIRVYRAFSDLRSVYIMGQPVISTITQTGSRTVTVSWGAVTYADGYVLYRSTTLGGTYTGVKLVWGATSVSNTVPSTGMYYYKVAALHLYGAKRVLGVQSNALGTNITY